MLLATFNAPERPRVHGLFGAPSARSGRETLGLARRLLLRSRPQDSSDGTGIHGVVSNRRTRNCGRGSEGHASYIGRPSRFAFLPGAKSTSKNSARLTVPSSLRLALTNHV